MKDGEIKELDMQLEKISLLKATTYIDDVFKVNELKTFFVVRIKELTLENITNAMELIEEQSYTNKMKLYVKDIDFQKLVGDIITPIEVAISKSEMITIYGVPIIREISFFNDLLGEGNCFLVGEK